MTAADTPGSNEPLLLAHADLAKLTAYLDRAEVARPAPPFLCEDVAGGMGGTRTVG
jgi:hypothetical protein